MAMKRTTVDGRVVNTRTAAMLERWQFNTLTDLAVVQGSYNAGGVAASAGTHDGGGAVDISVRGYSPAKIKSLVKAGRKVGFAAWHRTAAQANWAPHIHAIAIGDPELSRGAKNQVAAYYAGRNGLANNGADDGARVKINPWPVPVTKRVNMLTVHRQFKSKKPKAKLSIKRVQWVLNKKVGAGLLVDGIAGPKTVNAFKKFERKVGAAKVDGIPGKVMLKRLGEDYFKVYTVAFDLAKKK